MIGLRSGSDRSARAWGERSARAWSAVGASEWAPAVGRRRGACAAAARGRRRAAAGRPGASAACRWPWSSSWTAWWTDVVAVDVVATCCGVNGLRPLPAEFRVTRRGLHRDRGQRRARGVGQRTGRRGDDVGRRLLGQQHRHRHEGDDQHQSDRPELALDQFLEHVAWDVHRSTEVIAAAGAAVEDPEVEVCAWVLGAGPAGVAPPKGPWVGGTM